MLRPIKEYNGSRYRVSKDKDGSYVIHFFIRGSVQGLRHVRNFSKLGYANDAAKSAIDNDEVGAVTV